MLTIVGPHVHGTVTPQRLSTEMSSAAAAVAGRALDGRRGMAWQKMAAAAHRAETEK